MSFCANTARHHIRSPRDVREDVAYDDPVTGLAPIALRRHELAFAIATFFPLTTREGRPSDDARA